MDNYGRLTGASAKAGGQSSYLASPYQDPTAKAPHSNSLISMLPSALAAGASFIPGVGTLAATGLGAAGELIRQNMDGENMDLGKVAQEAALSAVPFGLGKVAKLAKLAKGVNVTAEGLKAAETAAKAGEVATKGGETAANAAAPATTFLGKIGANLTGDARGVAAGTKVAGQDQLGVADAAAHNGFLNSVGIKPGSAKAQLAQLEQMHQGWGKQIGELVDANNQTLTPSSLTAVKSRIAEKVGQLVGVEKAAPEGAAALVGADGKAIIPAAGVENHPYINQLYQDLGNVKDLKGLNNFRQQLDAQAINYGRNSAAAEPVKEQIAKAFRAGISEHVGEAIPQLKPVQNLYGQGAEVQDFLKNAAKAPGGVNIPFIGKVGGEAIQAAKAKAGAALSGTAPAAGGGAGFIGKAMGAAKGAAQYGTALAGQEITRGVADAAIPGRMLADNQGQVPVAPADVPGGAPIDPSAIAPVSAASPGIDYNLEADRILHSGADAKTQSAQLDLLAKRQAIEAATVGKSAKPVSSAANQQIANATSGLNQLDILSGELKKNPGIANVNDAASVLPGVLGNAARGAAGTQDFNTSRNEIVDVLARLRTGAAITASEEKQYKAMLPTAGDTPETAANKINIYRALFNGILERSQAGSPAGELAGIAS